MGARLKKIGIFLAVLFLIVLTTGAGFYVVANVVDIKVDALNINPSDKEQRLYFPPFTFPPTTGSGIEMSSNSMIIHLEIYYNGTLAEGVPTKVETVGTLNPDFAKEISSVEVYFEGALPYGLNKNVIYYGNGGATMYPSNTNPSGLPVPIFLGAYLVGEPELISWQVQGDYYPILEINYANFTRVVQTFQDFRIHVSSSDVIQQERYSRVNTALSISIALFAFVEAFKFIWNLANKKKLAESDNKGTNQATDSPKTEPNKWHPNKFHIRKQKRHKT